MVVPCPFGSTQIRCLASLYVHYTTPDSAPPDCTLETWAESKNSASSDMARPTLPAAPPALFNCIAAPSQSVGTCIDCYLHGYRLLPNGAYLFCPALWVPAGLAPTLLDSIIHSSIQHKTTGACMYDPL